MRSYYELTKPGIIYGNDLSAVAGFCLAAALINRFDISTFLAFLGGTSLVIGCGCVINNYTDRGIDRKMKRTSKRALVVGQVSGKAAIIYGSALGLLGFALLAAFTNWLTFGLGALGLFFYLGMYAIWKRRTPLGTLVGSVSGAVPITAGYTAASGHIDGAAVILFASMVFWQMPHFYAIAMYRLKDYEAAGLPVLPVKRGFKAAKIEIIIYTILFLITTCLLSVFGYTGLIYLAVMACVGFYWLLEGLSGWHASDDEAWAKHMFFLSLIVLLVWSIMVAVGAILP